MVEKVRRDAWMCIVCGELHQSEKGAKRCENNGITDYTSGIEVGTVIQSSPHGLDVGREWIGIVTDIRIQGHEKGIEFLNYLSGEYVYAGRDSSAYWIEVDEKTMSAWKAIIKEVEGSDE